MTAGVEQLVCYFKGAQIYCSYTNTKNIEWLKFHDNFVPILSTDVFPISSFIGMCHNNTYMEETFSSFYWDDISILITCFKKTLHHVVGVDTGINGAVVLDVVKTIMQLSVWTRVIHYKILISLSKIQTVYKVQSNKQILFKRHLSKKLYRV